MTFSLSAFLVHVLEEHSCRLDWETAWVFETLLEIGILLPLLHKIYDRLFKSKVGIVFLRICGHTLAVFETVRCAY